MKIHKAWLTTVPAFLLAAACSDAPTATSLAPQAAQLEAAGTTTALAECQMQFDAIIASTQTVLITSKNADRDRAGLLKILSDANALLGAGKNGDAVQKLTDFIVKVGQLEAAGRLGAASAEELTTGANGAIACINGIGA